MLKREGQIIKSLQLSDLMSIIKEKADKEATIYTDGFRTYDGLADFGYKRHFRIKHSENEFAKGRNHINGIENFWRLCKVRLTRFRGVHKHKFYIHQENVNCEYRYNNRDKNLYLCLCKLIRNNPLKLS